MKRYMVLLRPSEHAEYFDNFRDAQDYMFTAASQLDDPAMCVWNEDANLYEVLYE